MTTRVTLTTANTPGAVAIIHLHGGGVLAALRTLTGRERWPVRRAMLADFAGIDEGLAICFSGGQAILPVDRRSRISGPDEASGLLTGRNACPPQAAQLMPHGGPRVVQRLIGHLTEQLGCIYEAEPDPQTLYPEAGSPIEADMLDTIARAVSPAAIDLLSQQPALWRGLLQRADEPSKAQRQAIADRSRTLNRLVTPPTVVVAGPANVGKSTLTNALMGKRVSIVADLPGTTRDWVGGLVELGTGYGVRGTDFHSLDPVPGTPYPGSAIAVNWLDTPGLRDSDDAIEQRAIALARHQIAQADVLIAMRDPDQPWPDREKLPREPDLYVVNKVDDAQTPQADAGATADQPLLISAAKSINLDALQSVVIQQLGLDELCHELWAFTNKLLAWCESGEQQILAKELQHLSAP